MGEEEQAVPKGMASSALLLAAVAAILLTGMVLRGGGANETQGGAAPAASSVSLPLGAAVAVEAAPPLTAPSPAVPESVSEPVAPPVKETAAPTADPTLVKLASRAENDASRLTKARGRWTAQLLVACKPETVERVLESAGGSTKVYVLPARVRDDACFRVCYGIYTTSKDASIAADLPKSLRGKERIGAVEVAKVLP